MKELAGANALSFPQLLTAAQRMTAMGMTVEQVNATVQRTADIAFASGRSFDEVSNSMERMALSGTLNNRQLVQLGVSMDDFVKALEDLGSMEDLNAETATKMFKALDMEDRLKVIDDATKKFAGDGKQAVDTLSGSWQNLKTQFDLAMDGMGEKMATTATAVTSWLGKLIQDIRETFTEENFGFPSEEQAADTGKKWAEGLNLPQLKIVGDDVKTHIQNAFDSIGDTAKKAGAELGQAFGPPVLLGIQALDTEAQKLAQGAMAALSKAVLEQADAWQAWGTKLPVEKADLLNTTFDRQMATLENLPKMWDAATGAQTDYINDLQRGLTDAADLQNAFQALGVKSNQTFTDAAAKAKEAYETIKDSGTASALEIEQAWLASAKAIAEAELRTGQITIQQYEQVQKDLDNVATDIQNKLGNGLASVWQQITNQAEHAATQIEKQFSSALAGIITGTESIGKAFQKLGQQILTEFIDIAVQGLVQWLAQLIGVTAAGKAAQSAADVGNVTGQAGVTFAAAYSSVMAALPYPANIAAAPGVAAAEMAAVLGVGVPLATFEEGGYVPQDMLAMVHAGEYFEPSGTSGQYGGSAGSGTVINVNLNAPINGVTRDLVNQLGQEFARQIKLANPRFGSL